VSVGRFFAFGTGVECGEVALLRFADGTPVAELPEGVHVMLFSSGGWQYKPRVRAANRIWLRDEGVHESML
jgi:hypothetical protein